MKAIMFANMVRKHNNEERFLEFLNEGSPKLKPAESPTIEDNFKRFLLENQGVAKNNSNETEHSQLNNSMRKKKVLKLFAIPNSTNDTESSQIINTVPDVDQVNFSRHRFIEFLIN